MDDDDFCFTSDDDDGGGDGRQFGAHNKRGGRSREGGGGGKRGRRRGAGQYQESSSPRRFSSTDSFNWGEGGKGGRGDNSYRGKGGRRDDQSRGERGHQRNESSDSRGYRGRDSDREGYGGGRRGGDFQGSGRSEGSRGGREEFGGGRRKNERGGYDTGRRGGYEGDRESKGGGGGRDRPWRGRGRGGGGVNEGRGDDRRGRGGAGGQYPRDGRPKRFPLRIIADIQDVDDVTLRLFSQINEFEVFLSGEVLSMDDALRVLRILGRVVQNELQRASVLHVLTVVCSTRFLDAHLIRLVHQLPTVVDTTGPRDTVEFLELLHQLLCQVCLKLPSSASKVYLLLMTLNDTPEVMAMLKRQKPSLIQDLDALKKESKDCMSKQYTSVEEKKEQRQRWRRGHNEDEDVPPEDFTELPILPSPKDMTWDDTIFLRANKKVGGFRDMNHYLDVQFRLMREDYIRPLREGIQDYKQLTQQGKAFNKHQDLRLYTKVEILSMVCKDSVEHRVQFSLTKQLKGVRWQASKRLLFGSLVCLSTDDFDNLFFAVVTNRDVKDLAKGIIQIRFENNFEDILDSCASETFIMAETTAYFEAYRHVLEGLQEMKDKLPFQRYLVHCDPAIRPPQYLLTDPVSGGRMDLSCLLADTSRHAASSVALLKPHEWPPLRETALNASQMDAVKTALTKELAIIQGPPGTGKTYVGLKVARVLLENRDAWTDPGRGSRPILVVCYTNHALDQFLEGILDFCPEGIVRVGSRCKNPELEPFSLKNIRKEKRLKRQISLSVRNSIRDCSRELWTIRNTVDGISAKLEASAASRGIMSIEALQHHMLPGQFDSLKRGDLYSQPVAGDMMAWLSAGMITKGTEELENEDPYIMLAAEATPLILQGDAAGHEDVLDPNELNPAARAHVYRFWLKKTKALLEKQLTAEKNAGSDASHLQRWIKKAECEILPDSILQHVISGPVFSAITYPLAQHHAEQTAFWIRAWLGISDFFQAHATTHFWLGISDLSSQKHLEAIIGGEETVDERSFKPQDMSQLPRKTRFQLYRYWLDKVMASLLRQSQQTQNSQEKLRMAETHILPDEVLQEAVNPALFNAIKNDMKLRHARQKEYFIKAWLGVQEFCQNPLDLERLLDLLEDDPSLEGESLNIEEEAETIQYARTLDDDDDLFNFSQRKSRNARTQGLGVQFAFARSSGGADEEGFSVPKYHKKKREKQLKSLLTSSQPMTEEEASRAVSLWSQALTVEHRVRLYLYWLKGYKRQLRQSVQTHAEVYNRKSEQLRELRMGEDKEMLQDAAVIGMTTTGAARYRRVLGSIACPIVILEEAAEVLEAHVVTTLHKQCQHLILIGDHQQLKPSPTVYELSRHYNLGLSLFERLVNNKLPHAALAVQHRMRPELGDLMRHIYPNLQDHPSTASRANIRGLQENVFLCHHEEKESHNSETSSKSNAHEAGLCVRLCRYLLQQGYAPEDITILTAYSGQVFALKNIMKKTQEAFRGVLVTAVDNYQGEENEIIILSLVRSNQEGSVGFLSTDNRVCVALSRARDGFYAFGNFKNLADKSQLWKSICRTAKEKGRLGDALVLRCENHRDQLVAVKTQKDFDQVPEGGCKLPCGARLGCGHVCELVCHVYDRKHKKTICRKECARVTCKRGHPCSKQCHEDCGECLSQVVKVIPICGHTAIMPCSTRSATFLCQYTCKGTLPCGHQCTGKCGDCKQTLKHVAKCTVEVEKVRPCGHPVKTQCHVDVTLHCGKCLFVVEKVIPTCGHKVSMPCSTKSETFRCQDICKGTLPCGHRCTGKCGDCKQSLKHVAICTVEVEKVRPCGHPLKTLCHVAVQAGSSPCDEPCTATLDCRHTCQGTCGQCRAGRLHAPCKMTCGLPLPGCGHKCQLPCGTACLPCTAKECQTTRKQPDGDPNLPGEEIKDQVDTLCKQQKDLSKLEFLKFVYTTHPPKHSDNKMGEVLSHPDIPELKKLYKKAVTHYHPDKVSVEEHGEQWKLLTQEITKLLNAAFKE